MYSDSLILRVSNAGAFGGSSEFFVNPTYVFSDSEGQLLLSCSTK